MSSVTQITGIIILIVLMGNSLRLIIESLQEIRIRNIELGKVFGITNVNVLQICWHWVTALIISQAIW